MPGQKPRTTRLVFAKHSGRTSHPITPSRFHHANSFSDINVFLEQRGASSCYPMEARIGCMIHTVCSASKTGMRRCHFARCIAPSPSPRFCRFSMQVWCDRTSKRISHAGLEPSGQCNAKIHAQGGACRNATEKLIATLHRGSAVLGTAEMECLLCQAY